MSTSEEVSTIQRSANRDARTLIQQLKDFNGSNAFSRTHHATQDRPTDIYVVYSFGEHYPLYVAETMDGITKWYENADWFSRTTSKHRSQFSPLQPTTKLNTNDMMRMTAYGIAGVVAHKEF